MTLPQPFIASIRSLLGGEADAFLEALAAEPQVSVRLNRKTDIEVGSLTPVPWCSRGYYLSERPQFTFDPLFHAGCYYVQEASSMFLWQVLSQYVQPSALVLDACAAPGGKSTLIADYLSSDGMLVCNEYVPQRAHVLAENVQKWGTPICVVTMGAVSHYEYYESMFDTILVDAPCSGEGMFRKDDKAVEDWSEDNVRLCVGRQREILRSAWTALRDGGTLIYSTCTYNRFENEENVQWLIDEFGAECLPVAIDAEWGIARSECGYRFFPHLTRGEGLFMAVLRKGDAGVSSRRLKPPKRLLPADDTVLSWLCDAGDFRTIVRDDMVYAVPCGRYALVASLLERLNVVTFGVALAVRKGKNLIPQQGLALSRQLSRGAFPECETDVATALAYLRCEPISTPESPQGFVLVTHKSVPLGFVKNLGSRANNLYPDFWRIRSALPLPLPCRFYE